MAETLIGVCQVCGRKVEFDAAQSGQWANCPHCQRPTRLKPAPPDWIEAAPPESSPTSVVLPAPDTETAADETLHRLRRSYLKLGIFAAILLAILVGLVWLAEWLRSQASPH